MRTRRFISILTVTALIASAARGKEPAPGPQTTVTIVNKSGVEVTGVQLVAEAFVASVPKLAPAAEHKVSAPPRGNCGVSLTLMHEGHEEISVVALALIEKTPYQIQVEIQPDFTFKLSTKPDAPFNSGSSVKSEPSLLPPPRDASGGIADPRSGPALTILYKNQKDANQSLSDALMVFARHDIKPSNEISGVKGSFTDDQIVAALNKFYEEWRAPAGTGIPRPKLILASQNWGCGAGLYEPLKRLSAAFEIDVYQFYPVISRIESKPGHPGISDKRLGEILNGDK